MQKTTEEGKTSSSVDSRLKISGMTREEASLLNDPIASYSSPRQSLSRGPQYLKQKKKQKHGCLIKDFRHDEKGGRHS